MKLFDEIPAERPATPLLDALEPIYKKASQHAVVFLLGEPLS